MIRVHSSLIPRPFERRRKGLVHTVCVCVKISVKSSVKHNNYGKMIAVANVPVPVPELESR